MLTTLGSIIKLSGIVPILALAGGLYAWHVLDKGSAVRSAVNNYVAADTIETLKAEKAELKRRNDIFASEKERLEQEVEARKAEQEQMKAELDEIIANRTGEKHRPISDDVFGRLRNR